MPQQMPPKIRSLRPAFFSAAVCSAGGSLRSILKICTTTSKAKKPTKERAALKVYAPTCSVLVLWATKEEPQIMAVMMGNTT